MAEEVLGIQCYVNDVPGFSGVLKHRYADFCVNEVDLEGDVVQLTNLRPPPKEMTAALNVKDLLLPQDFGRQVTASPGPPPIAPAAIKSELGTSDGCPAPNGYPPPAEALPSPAQSAPQLKPEPMAEPAKPAEVEVKAEVANEGEVKLDPPDGKDVTAPVADEVSTAVAAFRELVGPEDAAKLETMLRAISAGEQVAPLVLQPDADKAHRTAVHGFFKTRLPMLVTDTVDFKGARCFAPSDGKVPNQVSQKSVRIHLNKKWKKGSEGSKKGDKRGNKRSNEDQRGSFDKRQKTDDAPMDNRGANAWPKECPKHLRFTLYKENKDSHEAMGLVGKMLGVLPRAFGYAGTKDKRGVTVQHVTLHKVTAEKLAALNPRLFSIQVGNFTYVPEGLTLGQLSGNQFAITLRSVPLESQEHAVAAAEALQRHGFVNYFGLQRFGTGKVKTHEIGAALLKGAFKRAVDLLLSPREDEREDAAAARAYFSRTRDAAGTLKRMPYYMNAERSILERLKTAPHDWIGSLGLIPRTLRMMYVHAYQSYLWNHAATHRIMLYGSERAVEGDLVFAGEPGPTAADSGVGTEGDTGMEDTVDFDVPASHRVKHVTQEEAAAGSYSIEDVLLPLPGGSTQYPLHETERVYQDIAQQHGVNLQRSPHNVKEYSISHLTGGYRKLLQKPRNMEWQLIRYSDPDQPLWPTAVDRIAAQPDAPKWLGRFRQGNGRDAAPQTDALSALKSSVRVVRGGILSKEMAETSAEPSLEGGTREKGTAEAAAEGTSSMQLNGMEAAEAKPAVGASSVEVANGSVEGSGAGASGTPVEATTVVSSGAEKVGGGAQGEGGEQGAGSEDGAEGLGKFLGLQIKMILPSSCYATMAIRELLKSSTSKDFHKELQKEHNK